MWGQRSFLHLIERCEPLPERVVHGIDKVDALDVGRKQEVNYCPERRGYAKAFHVFNIVVLEFGLVQSDFVDALSASTKIGRYGHVYAIARPGRKLVNRQGGVMRDHALRDACTTARPQRCHNEIGV